MDNAFFGFALLNTESTNWPPMQGTCSSTDVQNLNRAASLRDNFWSYYTDPIFAKTFRNSTSITSNVNSMEMHERADRRLSARLAMPILPLTSSELYELLTGYIENIRSIPQLRKFELGEPSASDTTWVLNGDVTVGAVLHAAAQLGLPVDAVGSFPESIRRLDNLGLNQLEDRLIEIVEYASAALRVERQSITDSTPDYQSRLECTKTLAESMLHQVQTRFTDTSVASDTSDPSLTSQLPVDVTGYINVIRQLLNLEPGEPSASDLTWEVLDLDDAALRNIRSSAENLDLPLDALSSLPQALSRLGNPVLHRLQAPLVPLLNHATRALLAEQQANSNGTSDLQNVLASATTLLRTMVELVQATLAGAHAASPKSTWQFVNRPDYEG